MALHTTMLSEGDDGPVAVVAARTARSITLAITTPFRVHAIDRTEVLVTWQCPFEILRTRLSTIGRLTSDMALLKLLASTASE
jgi:hypothetical protein